MAYDPIERWEWEGGALAPQEEPRGEPRDEMEWPQESAAPDDASAMAGSGRGGSRVVIGDEDLRHERSESPTSR